MVTKTNSRRRVFRGRVGMERLNGAVDKKQLGIGRFTDRINFEFVSFLGVPSMRYMGSPEMVQIRTLVIIAGNRFTFESTRFTYLLTWRVGTGET